MRRLLPTGPTAAGWLRRAVVLAAAAYLLILPQVAADASFFGMPGRPGPLAVLVLGLGLWLMPVLLVASWAAEGRLRLPHPLLTIPAILFVIGAAVSTAAASDKSSALVRSAEMTGLWVGMWALAQALVGEGERRFLLAALVTAGMVSAAVAVSQAAGAVPRAAVGRPDVPASLLALALFAAVGLSAEKWAAVPAAGGRALAAVAAASAVLCAVGIALATSRAAAVAAVALGAYWVVVARGVRRRRVRLALLLLPVALGAAGLVVAAEVDHPAVASAMTPLRDRLDGWAAALKILSRHGATGVGLENVGSHYLQHKAARAPEGMADPHNMVLSVWSTTGLAGLAALVLVWATAVRAWRREHVERGGSEPVPSVAEGQPPRGPAELRGGGGDPPREPDSRRGGGGPPREPDSRRGGYGDPPRQTSPARLPGLIVPTVALAGPAVFWFLAHAFGGLDSAEGLAWGMGGVAGMAMLAGLLPAERLHRLEASGRPMARLRTACVVGLAAFALAQQIGTAVLDPATAWAMLVLLVVTLGAGRGSAAGIRRSRSGQAPTRRAYAPVARPIGLATRFVLVLAAMGFCFAYARFLIVPVAQERRMLKMARFSLDTFGVEPTRAAAKANPLGWEPAYLRGHLWHRRAREASGPAAAVRLERAIEGYRAALRRHPRLRRAHLAMADACLALPGAQTDAHLLAKARAALEAAARLSPTHLATRLRLARVLDRLGRPREALAEYEAVLRLDGRMPTADRRLGEADRAAVRRRLADLCAEAAEGSTRDRDVETPNSP